MSTAIGGGAADDEIDPEAAEMHADASAKLEKLRAEVTEDDGSLEPLPIVERTKDGKPWPDDDSKPKEEGGTQDKPKAEDKPEPKPEPKETPEPQAKPTEEAKKEKEEDATPEEANRWHPAARKHIDKILGEKKQLRDQLKAEKKVIDEFAQLSARVGVPVEHLPSFLQLTGDAIIHGKQDAIEKIGEALMQRGWKPSAQSNAGGFTEAELSEVAKIAASAALEDFDAETATKKAVDAVRSRRAAGSKEQPKVEAKPAPQSETRQAPTTDIPQQTRDYISRLGADISAKHGADAQRIAKAVANAITQGKVPRDHADWPVTLEALRDAEVARIAAERAAAKPKQPPTTTETTTTRGGPGSTSRLSELRKEAGFS
jgi:methanogenic corrinoid protein MtbC1